MRANHELTRAGAIIAVVLLVLIGVTVLIPRLGAEDAPRDAGRQSQPSVDQPVISKAVSDRQRLLDRGLRRITKADGTLPGLTWSWRRESGKQVSYIDLDGISRRTGTAAVMVGTLVVRWSEAQHRTLTQASRVLRQLLADPDLTLVYHARTDRVLVRSEVIIASPVAINRKRLRLTDVHPVSICKTAAAKAHFAVKQGCASRADASAALPDAPVSVKPAQR